MRQHSAGSEHGWMVGNGISADIVADGLDVDACQIDTVIFW